MSVSVPFLSKGFASKLRQPQDAEEKEKEGESQNSAMPFSEYFLSDLPLFSVQKASKTVENATGQPVESEAAE